MGTLELWAAYDISWLHKMSFGTLAIYLQRQTFLFDAESRGESRKLVDFCWACHRVSEPVETSVTATLPTLIRNKATYFSKSTGPFIASTLPYFLFLVETS